MKRIALFSFCLVFSTLAHTASLYVSDNLRIGVRTEPGTQTAPITIISSGAKIEALENDDKYTKIRTTSGVVGWVRSSYLNKTAPAKIRLAKIKADYKTSQQEILVLQERLVDANNNNAKSEQKTKLLNNEIYVLHQQLSALRPDSHSAWTYMLIAALALCGLAFTLGILWNKQQVAKKLGGQSL